MTQTAAVLIAGAGPTGLTLACELARYGVPFRLVESAPGPRPGSRGKGIQPRTIELFDDLGIGERVIAHGRFAMPIRTTDPDGRVTLGGAEPDALKNRPDIPYTTSLITPEWRTEEALRLHLTELGGEVDFGVELQSFEQSPNGVSAVLLKDGRSETVSARWLVGCDGGHSVVRTQAGIAFVGETHEEIRMLVADLQVEGVDRDAWHMWRHPDGLLALCPLPSTDVFQYQALLTPGQEPDLSLDHLQAILDQRTARTDIRLHPADWSSLWRANIRLVDRYRDGHVFLAGDAAHIHSPAGGQGMNTGIQDAYNLGWKLAAVTHGAHPSLLDTYEAERRPIAAGVLALSNTRLRQTLEHQDLRRDASTIQLDIGYRESALARDDRDDAATLRAGDRAPDATDLRTSDGSVHRLFELTGGGRFTLLSFSTAWDAPWAGVGTLRVVDQATDVGDVVDEKGHLRRAYGATDRTLVLIRPDGYVALISDAGEITSVTKYLAAIGWPAEESAK